MTVAYTEEENSLVEGNGSKLTCIQFAAIDDNEVDSK